MAQSFMFSTDVWIDEIGSDTRDQSQKYGYALCGQTPVVHRFHSRGRRTNAIAAITTSGLVGLELTTASRPEIIMPQTFAIILFLNSLKILLLFPNPLLLFSHCSQQMNEYSQCLLLQHQ